MRRESGLKNRGKRGIQILWRIIMSFIKIAGEEAIKNVSRLIALAKDNQMRMSGESVISRAIGLGEEWVSGTNGVVAIRYKRDKIICESMGLLEFGAYCPARMIDGSILLVADDMPYPKTEQCFDTSRHTHTFSFWNPADELRESRQLTTSTLAYDLGQCGAFVNYALLRLVPPGTYQVYADAHKLPVVFKEENGDLEFCCMQFRRKYNTEIKLIEKGEPNGEA
jgi:hypothetical protein